MESSPRVQQHNRELAFGLPGSSRPVIDLYAGMLDLAAYALVVQLDFVRFLIIEQTDFSSFVLSSAYAIRST
jgi:hypothetical protein